MRKYGKWALTLGLLAATPGLTLADGTTSAVDGRPAVTGQKVSKGDNQRIAEDIATAMRGKVHGDVNIEVKDGVATLSGSVSDSKLKDRASALTGRVPGVLQVNNELSVVERNRRASARSSDQSDGGVVSANHEGSGQRSNRVRQVNNVVPAPTNNNQVVAEKIGSALAGANLDGYDIQVRFQNGTAMLDGTVGTQAERATASRVVQSIPGVVSVVNRLGSADGKSAPPAAQMGPMHGGPAGPQANIHAASYRQSAPPAAPMQGVMPGPGPGQIPGAMPGAMPGGMPAGPGGPAPAYGHPGMGANPASFNGPSLPDYAWPSYAQYPNSAAVSYPTQYSASAFPYIGPFYPYPQVPLGWRDATLRWDDGQWNLMFRSRTDKWWWFMSPKNW